jgi:hypothetical protein
MEPLTIGSQISKDLDDTKGWWPTFDDEEE